MDICKSNHLVIVTSAIFIPSLFLRTEVFPHYNRPQSILLFIQAPCIKCWGEQ